MARHRKVAVAIWNDEKFLSLSDDGQLLFLYLLTHPHQTSLGAMQATMGGLADERRWLPERLSKAFAEVTQKGMAKFDSRARCLWLPNFLKYNGPESPNVVKAWFGALDLIPECTLKTQAIQRAKAILEDYDEAFGKAFAIAFRKAFPKGTPSIAEHPSPNQEQEQEQRPDQEPIPLSENSSQDFSGVGPKKSSEPRCPVDSDGEKPRAPADDDPLQFRAGPNPTPIGSMAVALRNARVIVTSEHPTLLAWIRDGITTERLLEAVSVARMRKPMETIQANYLDRIVRDSGKSGHDAQAAPATPRKKSVVEIESEAIENGIAAGKSDREILAEINSDFVSLQDIQQKRTEMEHAQH